MITYSVQITIQKDITLIWEDWMMKKHVPDVMNSGMFLSFKLHKKRNELPTKELYVIDYTCDSIFKYMHYQKKIAKKLQNEHSKKFKNNFSAKREVFIQIS